MRNDEREVRRKIERGIINGNCVFILGVGGGREDEVL